MTSSLLVIYTNYTRLISNYSLHYLFYIGESSPTWTNCGKLLEARRLREYLYENVRGFNNDDKDDETDF
uniref:Uncharacterized protein n=1 Tax=Glossina morsitans morsitans TaxID=37546 RepID=A0A1B0FNN2_GLOMM